MNTVLICNGVGYLVGRGRSGRKINVSDLVAKRTLQRCIDSVIIGAPSPKSTMETISDHTLKYLGCCDTMVGSIIIKVSFYGDKQKRYLLI